MFKSATPESNGHGSLKSLLPDVLTAGSPLPLLRQAPAIPNGMCVVLNMRHLSLSSDRRRSTSVLEASFPKTQTRFVCLQIADHLGIRLYCPQEHVCSFDEQVFEFSYSETPFGQRSWLACPGLEGGSCSTKGMKLFLPYDGCQFACADCHGLSRGRGRLLYRRGEKLTAFSLEWRQPEAYFGQAS